MFSCSVYGVDTDDDVSGETKPNPQTAYAICKTLGERDLKPMDDKNFAPCYFRNATARSRSGWRNICARGRPSAVGRPPASPANRTAAGSCR